MMASGRVVNADEVEVEMTIRMAVKEWRALLPQLSQDWPAWQLSERVSKMLYETIERVEKVWGEEE